MENGTVKGEESENANLNESSTWKQDLKISYQRDKNLL